MNVEAVQGKQFPLEWTETSGGLLEWRHEPGVALAFPVEFLSPFLWRAPPLEMRPNSGNSFPSTQGKDPSVELGGGNGAPLDVGGTLVLPLEWRRVCWGTS